MPDLYNATCARCRAAGQGSVRGRLAEVEDWGRILGAHMNVPTLVPEAPHQVVMNVHEVARYLRLSEAKIYRMAKAGTIPAFQVGRAWRFSKDLIDDWILRLSSVPVAGGRVEVKPTAG